MKLPSVSTGRSRTRFLADLFALVLAFAAGTALADRRIYLATAARGNGSGSDPANARAYDDKFVIYRALANDPDPVVELHFAAGTYSMREFIYSPASGDREKIVVRFKGDGDRPEDTVIRNDKPLVHSGQDTMLRLYGLGRIELENLAFDGNWDEKMRLAGHPAFNPNYKNQPLNLTARTGLVRRVIVRNCGSIGYIPQSRFDNVGGTEAFPLALGTTDVGQEPAPGAPTPWVVEDCEIHGFHPEFGGYTTMLMAGASRVAGQTPDWAAADLDRRLITVRRCMVRGVPGGAGIIAFGSAGCGPGEVDGGRVTYSDNVLLNASLGFNTDCGHLVNFWVTNSVFLDVWTTGNIGALYPGMMDRYRVSGNAVRLAGRAGHPTYQSFAWRDGHTITDTRLVLGRHETNEATGVGVGAAGKLRWENNWFTTRPRSQFAPEGTDPTYRLFRKFTAADTSAGGGFQDIAGMEAAGNGLSGAPWDFVRIASLPGGRHDRFGVDTVPELTRPRQPLEQTTDDFRPIGTVERVLPVYVARTVRWQASHAGPGGAGVVREHEARESVLDGVVEVSIGQPRLDSGGDLRLSARLALQPTPGSGRGGTVPLRGSNVWMEVSGPVTTRVSGNTDARGIVEFRVPASGMKPGVLQLRAVHEADATRDPGTFREYRSAIASASHPFGTVISVEALPDVAQAGGQHARFVLRRTGRSLAELPELAVLFRLASDSRSARWGDDFELVAPEGTRANLDRLARGGIGRVFFPSGDRAVALDVVPHTRASERGGLVQLQVVAGSALPYGVGDTTATVLLHPGPEWALEILNGPGSGGFALTALSGVVPLGTNAVAHAVGMRRDAAGHESAAAFDWHRDRLAWDDVSAGIPDAPGVRPVAVTHVANSASPLIAGNRTGPGGPVPWTTSGDAPGANPALGPTRLTAVSDDGSWFAGVAGEKASRRAVAWRAGGAPSAAVLPAGVSEVDAVAIDGDGRLAGNARKDGRAVAFRTGKGAAGTIEWLAALDAGSDAHVSDMSPGGLAVGWSSAGDRRRAVAWPSGGGAAPIELSRVDGVPESMAIGVNATGEVIALAGRGGRLSMPYLVAAVAGGAWKPLDDPHFVSGIPQGFDWGTPVAVNDQGWIAGNGRWQDRAVAWVLRRNRAR